MSDDLSVIIYNYGTGLQSSKIEPFDFKQCQRFAACAINF